jgi:hypothetical protein
MSVQDKCHQFLGGVGFVWVTVTYIQRVPMRYRSTLSDYDPSQSVDPYGNRRWPIRHTGVLPMRADGSVQTKETLPLGRTESVQDSALHVAPVRSDDAKQRRYGVAQGENTARCCYAVGQCRIQSRYRIITRCPMPLPPSSSWLTHDEGRGD